MKTADESILIFCENVKLIREKNNLSQKDMAKIMGIGVPSLKKLESGCICTFRISNILPYEAPRIFCTHGINFVCPAGKASPLPVGKGLIYQPL